MHATPDLSATEADDRVLEPALERPLDPALELLEPLPGEPASVAEEAWGLLFALALRNRARLVDALTELGLTFPQAHLLRLLAPAEARPMGELAERLVCDASNVTGLADRLEARQLVERRTDPTDRRVKMLALTDAGEGVRARVIRAMQAPPAQIAALAAGDQLELRAILRRALAGGSGG